MCTLTAAQLQKNFGNQNKYGISFLLTNLFIDGENTVRMWIRRQLGSCSEEFSAACIFR
jgi:hypothetical protein